MEKKKSIEFNFVTFLILIIILLVVVFMVARNTSSSPKREENTEDNIVKEQEENKPEKLYANNVIMIDENKLTENWNIVEQGYGSIIFFIQGIKNENEDGTTSDIKINFYMEKSEMTDEDLKKQMLEHSIYSKIEYTKIQEINKIQWMEFECENKGIKAKILAKMKDGYMYAIEICGEDNLYNQYYNEAMKIAMSTKIAEKIPQDLAEQTIYKYDNVTKIKQGGTQYLLNSLNLPVTVEQTDENSTLPEEYKDYKWTGIKYSDFENEMCKYMTKEILKEKFSEFIENKGVLFIKDVKGNQKDFMIDGVNPKEIKGTETTYEIVKKDMNTFITLTQELTLKYEDGKCVVSKDENEDF